MLSIFFLVALLQNVGGAVRQGENVASPCDHGLIKCRGEHAVTCKEGVFRAGLLSAIHRPPCPRQPDACFLVNQCTEIVARNGGFAPQPCGYVFYTPDGRVIEECSDLIDTYGLHRTWVLESYLVDGQATPIIPGPQGLATLWFSNGGTFGGTTGCNRFFGRYGVRQASVLEKRLISVTRKACAAYVRPTETELLNVLHGQPKFVVRREGMKLEISQDGAMLVLQGENNQRQNESMVHVAVQSGPALVA